MKYRKQINPEDNEFTKLRKNARLSQEELAYRIGVAASTLRRWEEGGNEPYMTIEQMRRFCKAVNQKFADLPDELIK